MPCNHSPPPPTVMSEANLYDRWLALKDDDISESVVRELLSSVQDDLWVAAACVDRILDDVGAQRALIDLGIERTEHSIRRIQNAVKETSNSSSDGEYSSTSLTTYLKEHVTDARLCKIRNILLGRRSRLRTFEELSGKTTSLDASEGNTTGSEEEGWDDDPWAGDRIDPGPSTVAGKRAVPLLPLSVFLTEDLSTICLSLASQGQFTALNVLVNQYPSKTFPLRFEILFRIPPFIDPSKYRDFLPTLDPNTGKERIYEDTTRRSGIDFAESDPVVHALSEIDIHLDETAVEDLDVRQAFHLRPDPLSTEELLAWYKGRVDDVISTTGMVDVALGLVQHGVSRGILGLDELGEELTLISRLIYDTPAGADVANEPITLKEWSSLEPQDIIERYLCLSRPETVVSDIQRLVMPYLFVLESRCERAGKPDPGLRNRLLYGHILNTKLVLVVPIFEASKPTQVASQRIISDDEDLARLALACLYGSDSLDDWTNMSRIFECLPAWNFASDENEEDEADTTVASLSSFLAPTTSRPRASPSDIFVFFKPLPAPSLSRALDILDVHLESGEILSRWGVPVPLRWFLQSAHDVDQQRAWATKMARQLDAPAGDLNSEDIWISLLDAMIKLSRPVQADTYHAFGALSENTIRQIFFKGLLSTGRFTIARRLMQPRHGERLLDPDTIENLCLECSREFYDNASSGNYNFGEMKLAYDCLSVAPQTYRIQREREFIEATSRISSFNVMFRPGVPLLPIEIRLTKDKLSLISLVLSSNESAYKHVEVLLELVRKLGYQGDSLAEVKTLAMVADSALQAEDFPRAFEASERMVNTVLRLRQNAPLGAENQQVREAVEVCWVACYQLGRQSEAQDVERKMTLLGRALELCPPDKIVDILSSWRKLEAEEIDMKRERITELQSRDSKQNGRTRGRTTTATLSSRLQNSIRIASPALPSASALASHTFSRVAAAFPFGMHTHSSEERSRSREGSPDVQAQARHALRKGVGWLIGADEDEL